MLDNLAKLCNILSKMYNFLSPAFREDMFNHGTIIRTGITCKKIPQ